MKADMAGVRSKIRAICKDQRLGSFLANEAAKGMDQYVPMRTGALAQSVSTKPFVISYGMKYATYPYHGRNMAFRRDKHPNATAYWDRAYAVAHGQQLGDAGTQFLRRMR